MDEVRYGLYACKRCGEPYTVNRPDTWDACTPNFCHACTKYLSQQYALVPDPEPLQ